MLLIKYTKEVYQAKIDKLESYYTDLSSHLQRMEELKKEMFTFWNDDAAKRAGQVLNQEIQSVQNAMKHTSEMIKIYRDAVSKFKQTGMVVDDLLEKALSAVSSLDDI